MNRRKKLSIVVVLCGMFIPTVMVSANRIFLTGEHPAFSKGMPGSRAVLSNYQIVTGQTSASQLGATPSVTIGTTDTSLESGNYDVTVASSSLGVSGDATLKITGDTFELKSDDKTLTGFVSTVTTRSYTAVALTFKDAGQAGGNPASPLTISLRAKKPRSDFVKLGDRVTTLSSVDTEANSLSIVFDNVAAAPSVVMGGEGTGTGGTGGTPTPTPRPNY